MALSGTCMASSTSGRSGIGCLVSCNKWFESVTVSRGGGFHEWESERQLNSRCVTLKPLSIHW